MTLTRYNNELVDTFKKVKAVDPTAIPSNLEGSLAEAYVGDLDFLERMYGMSDYNYKVSGSVVENGNSIKWNVNQTTLQAPTGNWNGEVGQSDYNASKTLDGTLMNISNNTNLVISQHLFSFDLLSYLEKRYGVWVWQGNTTLAQKVSRARNIIRSFTVSWYGYGSSPTGNKASFRLWASGGSVWDSGVLSHTSGTITKISVTKNKSGADDVTWFTDSNGFVHGLANADASNGTIPSVINTDYVKMEIVVDVTKL